MPAVAQAQSVTSYTYASSGSSAAAYTLLQPSSAAATRTAGTFDEGYYNNLPIGFSFVFAGTAYTTFSASTNGWMTFGQALANAMPANSLSTGTVRPIVAPLWDDISFGDVSMPPAPATDGNLYYQTSGTAGNRVCTIEWRNVRWSPAAAGPVFSCMVRLFEGTNVVQFQYLQGSTSAAGSTRSASVGLGGLMAGNFMSLSDLNLTATASTTTETSSIASRATSGRIFTFTPTGGLASRAGRDLTPLELAPNPAQTQVKVQGHDARQAVELLDAQGRLVRTLPLGSSTIALQDLARGLYLVRAGARTQRLVVE
ncbi:hypothetical protein GCM10023185_13670 [Hymenobacter saemangeumensis]|uniref:Secretion system C-terminal sorting domain-containing protein n=1 Tax=Hymenobacter saemangeumensis TaxID=1084522 RepID=A0ABP8I836_9BACT